jgi:hypothetical protein
MIESLPANKEIDDPAAADVRTGSAAVLQDGGVGAAGVFQGVGEEREMIEVTILIDGLRELLHGRGRASWVEGQEAEGVAEEATENP